MERKPKYNELILHFAYTFIKLITCCVDLAECLLFALVCTNQRLLENLYCCNVNIFNRPIILICN